MKLNKTTRRLLLLNLFLSTITHSMALKCFTKAVFSRGDGSDETWPLNGADTNDCADGETRCITVTGSFTSGENIAGTPMISMCEFRYFFVLNSYNVISIPTWLTLNLGSAAFCNSQAIFFFN